MAGTPHDDRTALARPQPRALEQLTVGQHVLILERTETGGVLRLMAPDGSQPVEIEITPAGPVLRMHGNLTLAVEGAMSLAADDLAIHARKKLALSSDGELDIRATGDMTTRAEAHTISARLGDVRLEANDDVVMVGERIKMNC